MTVYCLHYIGEGPMAVTVAQLEALVSNERADGRAFARTRQAGESTFGLSFDDAHISVLRAAEPLAALGLSPTLFVPTAYVGTHERYMSWDDLRRLRDEGWTLGSHGETHTRLCERLYDRDEVAHRARLDRELGRSRLTLERELRITVDEVAYPYGEHDDEVIAAARRAGYARGFVVGEGVRGDPLRVGRVDPTTPAPRSTTPTSFSVVVPAFERMGILSEVVTRLASQSYPEERYEVLVVDDGSTSDLSPIFDEMPGNVRLLRREGSDASFNAGQARQFGADHASFDTLAFLDADVLVDADYLWHLDWIHQRTDRAAVLGYLSGYNLHDLGHIHTLDSVRGDLAQVPTIPDRSREPSLRACLDHVDWLEDPWTLCYTGNLSLPASLLREVGGFEAAFLGWGLEDVDLGIRLNAAGCAWRFARFARGVHVVDPTEGTPRNPFRKTAPTPEDFAGYLENLQRMETAHASDPRVGDYANRARGDVAETVGRPTTVGIECGGSASVRSRHHARLFQLAPGGVPFHEKLDRIAYAAKVRAKCIYFLGGAVAEQDGFLELLAAASAAVDWVSMETMVYPFARDGHASSAVDAGLRGAVCVVHSFDRDAHDEVLGDYDAYIAGLDALQATELELSAKLVTCARTRASLVDTEAELARRGIRIEERVDLD